MIPWSNRHRNRSLTSVRHIGEWEYPKEVDTRTLIAKVEYSVILLLGLVAAEGCGDDGGGQSPGILEFGMYCQDDSDCVPGLTCEEWDSTSKYCTQYCISNEDCNDVIGGLICSSSRSFCIDLCPLGTCAGELTCDDYTEICS